MRELTKDELKYLGEHLKCPFCSSEDFQEGPSGGMCTNWFCGKCGAGFNLNPLMAWGELIREPTPEYVAETKERLDRVEEGLSEYLRRRQRAANIAFWSGLGLGLLLAGLGVLLVLT